MISPEADGITGESDGDTIIGAPLGSAGAVVAQSPGVTVAPNQEFEPKPKMKLVSAVDWLSLLGGFL